jgi:ankyrin repeat protein
MRVTLPPLLLFALGACAESPRHPIGLQDDSPRPPDRRPLAPEPALPPGEAREVAGLDRFIRSGKKDAVAAYLDRGGDPDATVATDLLHGNILDSLLSITIRSQQFEIARLLLDKGANPNGARGENAFPLWWAARSGDLGITKELVSRGADLNTQREGNGTTALHAAIYFDHPSITRLLADSGADVTRRTRDLNPWGISGATPLELAQELKHDECARVLAGR